MKKLFFSLFAALLLSTSNMAAACSYMNITSGGARRFLQVILRTCMSSISRALAW